VRFRPGKWIVGGEGAQRFSFRSYRTQVKLRI
jgi:hypothetical protein